MTIDPGLRHFVVLAEQGKASGLPVLLTIGGAAISGEIISTREFLDWAARCFKRPQSAETVNDDVSNRLLAEALPDLTVLGEEPLGSSSTEAEDVDEEDIFLIHLKGVTWEAPGREVLVLAYWRGQLEAVSGWTLGTSGMYRSAMAEILAKQDH